jgi:hypothetical protein
MGDLAVLFLFFVALGSIFIVGALLTPDRRRGRRARTDYQNAVLQRASNWYPGKPYECEDGKWRNSEGQEFERLTLSEFMAKYEKDVPPGHRRKKSE